MAVVKIKENSLKVVLIFMLSLHVFWIGTWLLFSYLTSHTSLFAADSSKTLFWIVMKIMVWILPTIFLIKKYFKSFWNLMGFHNWRQALKYALGSGLIVFGLAAVPKFFASETIFSFELNSTFFNAVIVAPVVEEIVFRGLILNLLIKKFSFTLTNIITSFFFVCIHIPGWYFQGHLIESITAPMGGALFIFLLGLIFGYVAKKSNSILGSTLTHMINNFFAS